MGEGLRTEGVIVLLLFSLYSELMLQTQKPHIQKFAVESFGFLLRKVRITGVTSCLVSRSYHWCRSYQAYEFHHWCHFIKLVSLVLSSCHL